VVVVRLTVVVVVVGLGAAVVGGVVAGGVVAAGTLVAASAGMRVEACVAVAGGEAPFDGAAGFVGAQAASVKHVIQKMRCKGMRTRLAFATLACSLSANAERQEYAA